ncbi:MAG: class I adenylate-forming enzyme family protein [Steroidobacteraceae bacterium]
MSEWGRAIEEKSLAGYSVKILHPRPCHLTSILTEAKKWGDREYLVFGARRITFSQFLRASGHCARLLRDAGILPGEVVLLNGANTPEWILAFWALVSIDAVVAQANAWWSAGEMQVAVNSLGARFVIADEKRRAHSSGAQSILPIEALQGCFQSEEDPVIESPALDEERPAVLIFTSGTTGNPKAAILSHRAVIACLHNVYAYRGRLPHEMLPDDPQMSLFCCNPLFHVGGMLLQCQTLLSGHRLVLLEGRATGETMMEVIERERINIWATVPTLLSRVIERAQATGAILSSVFSVSAAGSMVSPELMERAGEVFPSARNNRGSTYGMTESGGSVTMINGAEYLSHAGSAGKPFPTCDLRVANPNESGEGEIWMRTPSAMTAYWGTSEQIIDDEGWIHSGDLGRIDGAGYLYVTGRTKDIIIRGGENVSVMAIEQRLSQHPAVVEVAVVGLPHADLGEEVGAAVVLKQGATTTGGELAAFVASELAYFQVPTRWWVREQPLPTNAAGKIIKQALRAEWPQPAS